MSDRDAYVEKFKARIDQWNADIDKLEAKAKEARADARIEHEKRIREARAKRDAAQGKLDELRNASGEAWEDVKQGAERAWSACREAVEDAAARFKS